jgi:hypothetical protein
MASRIMEGRITIVIHAIDICASRYEETHYFRVHFKSREVERRAAPPAANVYISARVDQ